MDQDKPDLTEKLEADIAKKARKAEQKAADKVKKAAKAEKKSAKQAEKVIKEAEKAKRKLEKRLAVEAAEGDVADQEATAPAPEKLKKDSKPKTEKPKIAKIKSAPSSTMSLGAKLQAAARLARSNLAASLLKHDLYAGQEQVLFLLDDHGPLALTELAEKLDVRAPTITKTVTRMEAQGFLSRSTSRDDGRSIIISLTPDGRRVMKIGRDIVNDIEAAIFSGLNKEDRETLSQALDAVLWHVKG